MKILVLGSFTWVRNAKFPTQGQALVKYSLLAALKPFSYGTFLLITR